MTEAYPLAWPDGWPRTPDYKRERGYQFKQLDYMSGQRKLTTFVKGRDKLYDELRKLGATHVVVSSNNPTDRYGVPTEAKRKPADDGVAVYFQFKGRPMVMACDRFDNAAANMRSLGLAIEAMRQLERHGGGVMMERAFAGFVALPPPGIAARSHWAVLGLKPGASKDEVQRAWKAKAAAAHPDRDGGSESLMAEINAARDRALKEVGA